MAVRSCSSCSQPIGKDAIFCPHCLEVQVEADASWFPVTTKGSDNQLLQHDLVPEHRILPDERTKQLLKEYDIDRFDLPKIQDSDPAIKHLSCGAGDVIEIVRDSRTAGTAKTYRLVTAAGKSSRQSSAREEWRNPTAPAEDLYTATEELTEARALHILENLRAHIPPSHPGACEAIAVDREDAIDAATTRVREGVPYTFVQGELGYGKSFFIQWVRDRVFPTTAVSFVDLDETLTFANEMMIAEAFWKNLETPRSKVNDQYANGLDELWDTLLRQVANICANYYEGKGYKLQKNRVAESLSRAIEDILRSDGVEAASAEKLSEAARGYFETSVKSLSQIIEDDLDIDDASRLVSLIATLARLNGYRVMFGVDELEKSDRTEEHFEAIDAFVQALPRGVSLFVTGTPELVIGGQEGNALKETYRPLYERTVDNRIALDQPSSEDLASFADRLRVVETTAIGNEADREYSIGLEALGGPDEAVTSFLNDRSPSFRAFLTYVEEASQ